MQVFGLMVDLLPVGWIIVVLVESYEGGVIGRRDDGVTGGDLMSCLKRQQEEAEDASLWCTSVHDERGGAWSPILTFCALQLRKSNIWVPTELPCPRMLSF